MRTLLLLFAALAATAQPRVNAVANAADLSGTVAPGSLAVLLGTGLATSTTTAPSLTLPATLGGVSVSVGGRPARLSLVSPTLIQFQIPSGVPAGRASVVVTAGSVASPALDVPVTTTAPGVFQLGNGRALLQNQDYSINGTGNPALAGSTVTVYLTGVGATTPPVADGEAVGLGQISAAVAAATATIGGTAAVVKFVGLTPGSAGLAQADLEVPNVTSGEQPLVITLNGVATRPVQISVKSVPPETSGGGSGGGTGGGTGGGSVTGAPEGLQCVSGTVDSIIMSLQYKTPGLADEIVIGGTRICEKCDVKPPIFVEFVKQLEKTREDGTLVDACYDSAGRVNALQLRR